MGLLDWRLSGSVEDDIRIVLRAEGAIDLSTPACKQWARQFIRDIIPWWTPGETLSLQEACEVGARFGSRVAWGKQQRDG